MINFFRKSQKAEVQALEKKVVELQNSLSVLIAAPDTITNTNGNPYRDSKQAVTELARKYEGVAQWGVQQARNIIDVRSAFIIGQGIRIVDKDAQETGQKSREFEFIEEFVKLNNLDEEMPQELAKEGEIEGRTLVRLVPNPDKKNIDFRFIPYSVYGYEVVTDPNDYQKYLQVTYKDTKSHADVVIEASDFVYQRFAGRVSKVNDIFPKVGMVLRHIEDLDKALKDWRDINNLFAAPTPYFKCLSTSDAQALMEALKKINWKVGKMLVGTAEFSMVGPSDTGRDSLEKEIITLCKIISGATGVPVHFLGLPDLMSNRATSTDLFEFINASTNKERHMWEGFYEQLFDKAIEKANSSLRTNLQPGKVKAQILNITEAKVRELSEVWLPLYTAGVIDLDYMLSKIPDIDAAKAKQANQAEADRMLASVKAQEASANNPQDKNMMNDQGKTK